MPMMLTAVINDQSLLVQGIISHFRRASSKVNFEVVEIGYACPTNTGVLSDYTTRTGALSASATVLEKLIALHPDVVIVESRELSSSSVFPLNRLFAELPSLIVVEVNQETSNIQVIRSNQFKTTGVSDLLNFLENTNGTLPVAF